MKSEDPKSNEIFADDGTIAKHSDDNRTIKTVSYTHLTLPTTPYV